MSFLVCAGFFIFFVRITVLNLVDILKARVVPYFKRRREKLDLSGAFASGVAIARHCRRLDEIALERNLLPVSAFGFEDDWEGEEVQWHEPAQGLESMQGLLKVLRQNPELLDAAADVIADLGKIIAVLQKAQAAGIPFCLILRTGMDRAMAAKEFDCREGSFW